MQNLKQILNLMLNFQNLFGKQANKKNGATKIDIR